MASVGDRGVDAFELLHELAWREVFERVDLQDLYSLCNTCLRFQNMLEDSKWRWGFSLIFPHVAPYLSTKNDDVPPHLSHKRGDPNWTGLLKLRVISKSWCERVGDFLTSPKDFLKMESYRSKPRLTHNFRSIEDIEGFQQRFAGWRKNPFPGRAVDFSSFSDPIQNEVTYSMKISELVQVFGHHLHYLILDRGSTTGNSRGQYTFIRNLLVNLPNLKSLIFSSGLLNNVQVEEEDVANYLRENPLPPLPHLEEILMCAEYLELRRPLIQNYASQLKTFSDFDVSDEPPQIMVVAGMTRLENLRIYLYRDLANDQIHFDYLRQLPLSLKVIDFTIYGDPPMFHQGRPQTFHIDKLLQNVRHLPLLQTLRIRIWTWITLTESGLPLDEYRNESIKFFSLEYCDENMTVSFNFIEALKKVEVIEITQESDGELGISPERQHPPGTPETIQVYPFLYREGFEGDPYTRMYQSNIWELVPSLKTLKIRYSDENEADRQHQASFQACFSRSVYDRLRN